MDQALYGVILEAYIGGVSTRLPGRRPACRRHWVDALVAALGSQSGLSKSQVSRRGTPEIPGNLWGPRICQDIDQQVQAFVSRPLESSTYAYVYLDATYLKGRLGKALQVCSRAVCGSAAVSTTASRKASTTLATCCSVSQ